ncbi:hypothetical protein D8I35_09495 [Corticibacter populi]|uniref:Uncharacterized protein n=1 Tax=Corticibacter populi TaxID=1550736 RepID=A0A3M6QUL8_9BURK|nr:hypothetical protein [Corticibacter populi]RMX06725.1 hypothetical protein D8I35_09495 [Corticibacter populi]RZS31694.1 hypothetical protein EV687_2363 [Corticibacter populi]
MARIARIRQRLENWALWRSRLNSNGLGYHTRNILAVDVWDRNTYNGMSIPHISIEAEETDRAVQAMKDGGQQHLYEVVNCYHLQNLGVAEIALRTGRAVSTVHANLAAADRFVEQWLREQARKREEAEALRRGREWMSRR